MKVLAAVVTYHPEIPLLKQNLDALSSQVDQILVFDNASANIGEIRNLAASFDRVRLIENDQNLGLPANYNRAARMARDLDCPWLLLMDQDTVVPSDLIRKYMEYTSDPQAAVISPVVWDVNSLDPEEALRNLPEGPVSCVDHCISSASLNRVDILLAIGGFEERLFIDYVDIEYCMRARLNGYKILCVHDCLVKHRLGDGPERRVRFLWKKWRIRPYSLTRTYHFYRNSIYVARKYGDRLDIWPGDFRVFLSLLKKMIRMTSLDHPVRRCAMLVKGHLDGYRMARDPQAEPRMKKEGL